MQHAPTGGPLYDRTGAATNNDTRSKQSAKAPSHTDYGDPTSSWLTSSQQVNWHEVYQYVHRILEGLDVSGFPAAGTIAWCRLDDSDPAKLAAALAYAPHHALRLDTAQEARIGASKAISAAAEWAAIARRVQDHREFYAAQPWLRRTKP